LIPRPEARKCCPGFPHRRDSPGTPGIPSRRKTVPASCTAFLSLLPVHFIAVIISSSFRCPSVFSSRHFAPHSQHGLSRPLSRSPRKIFVSPQPRDSLKTKPALPDSLRNNRRSCLGAAVAPPHSRKYYAVVHPTYQCTPFATGLPNRRGCEEPCQPTLAGKALSTKKSGRTDRHLPPGTWNAHVTEFDSVGCNGPMWGSPN
jgi:hypothetical protein